MGEKIVWHMLGMTIGWLVCDASHATGFEKQHCWILALCLAICFWFPLVVQYWDAVPAMTNIKREDQTDDD